MGGADAPGVFNVWQVLNGEVDDALGEKVLLIDYDGHHQATATAEFLAELGKKVHVITSSLFVGSELGPSQDLYLTRQRLLQKGVTFTPDFAVMEIKHPGDGRRDPRLQRVFQRLGCLQRLRQHRDRHGQRRRRLAVLRPQGHDGGRDRRGAACAAAGAATGVGDCVAPRPRGHGHPRRLHGREARVSAAPRGHGHLKATGRKRV